MKPWIKICWPIQTIWIIWGTWKLGSYRKRTLMFLIFLILDRSLIMRKQKNTHMDIICDKFGHWENNCKNYLARLKQDACVASKGVYMIQIYFLLSGSNSDIWVLDTTCRSYIYNLLQQLQNIKGLKRGDLELYGASGESISTETVKTCMLDFLLDKILKLKTIY